MSSKIYKKNGKLILIIVSVLSIAVLIFSIYEIYEWKIESNKLENQVEDIYEIVQPIEKVSENLENVNPPEEGQEENPYWDYVKMPLINVDFTELKKINPETKGWIQVAGTNINYPFVQHSDNNFYLTHSFDKSKNKAGWVFLDSRNNIESFDQNTIIYAHGRADLVLFGTLKYLTKTDWINNKDNYIIKMATESGSSLWQIFSVYRIPTTSDYLRTEFDNEDEYKLFLEYLKGRSIHDFTVELNKNDKILTLSTCYNKTDKVVMHAKLILSGN